MRKITILIYGIVLLVFIIIQLFTNLTYADIINIPDDQPTIQEGINTASVGDSVLVQPGTYIENINYNGKNITVGSLYITTRDTTYISQTVIDGDSLDSVVKFENNEDSTAVLSGFTVTNGNASASPPYNRGGGIWCESSSPTITNVYIIGNIAHAAGGGIYCDSSSPILINVIISGNITDCVGGGLYCDYSSPSLTNVLIGNNIAIYGAGIFLTSYSSPILTNVTMTENTANPGNHAGLECEHDSSPILMNCILWNDSPQEIYLQSNSYVTITYSDIQGGWSGVGNIDWDPLFAHPEFGDFHLTAGSPCIDAGNPNSPPDPDGSVADMGAFYFDPSELFANFTAIPTFGTLPLEVQFIDLSRGNIINWQWDFQSDGIIDSYEQNPTFTYYQQGIYSVKLIVQDTTKADTLIKEDYITVNAPITIDGFAYLENQSNHDGIKVLFERTDPSSLFDSTFTDNDGYFSIDLEIGVYNITYSKDGYFFEYLYDQQLFSNTTLPDVTLLEYVTILNVPYAFSTIQLAIDYAFDGNIVLVQPGTYVENINFIGKNITVGSLFLTTGDTTYISQTIIDGNQNGHVVTFNSGEDSTTLLIGFTITNGYSSGSVPENNGGGIFCYSSNPCIEYVNINGNIAHYGSGGGISIQISNAVLNNVTICNNTAQGTIYGYGGGGGIFCGYDSNPILTDVIITGNTAIRGGGIEFSSADVPILNNVSITGNTATDSGGGIFCYFSNPSFNNVIINENIAGVDGGGFRCLSSPSPSLIDVLISCNNASNGGGFYSSSSSPSLTNVTISGNNANNNGGGIYSALNTITSIVLINSIVSYNTGNYGIYNDPDDPGILSISYSDFWDNEEGNFYNCGDSVGVNITTNANGDSCDIYYNIQLDPLFIDPDNGDYHLTEGSPCIDAGDPNSPPDPDGSVADMGAFYFETTQLNANFTASPTYGPLPLEVQFTDISNGNIISWEWDFQNDGIIDSYEQNPIFTYYQQGTYSVKLIVQDTTQTDTLIKEDYIAVTTSIIVNGFAYLENQTNHSGIKVLFERTAPSSLLDSTFTDSSGYFTINLETGWFDITYSKDDYHLEYLYNQHLTSNTTLPNVTLIGQTTMILNVPSQFSTIQSAIDYALDGDIVLVDTGRYYENINFNAKSITVSSLFLTIQDTAYISQTIIDGNQNGTVVKFINGEDSLSCISGFTITGGYDDYGGICCFNSSPRLENLIVYGNNAFGCGGGIFCTSSDPMIMNVVIKDNTVTMWDGGGFFCEENSKPTLINVSIYNNLAGTFGGGIACWSNSQPSFYNVDIHDNTAYQCGGVFCHNSIVFLTNATICHNSSVMPYHSSGIFSVSGADVYATNCIVWDNSPAEVQTYIGGSITITYSDIKDGWSGTGNIDSDPLFADPQNGDFNLTWANFPIPDSTKSPCIDTGDPDSPPDPDGTRSDMGAYYFDQVEYGIENTPILSTSCLLYQNYPNPFNSSTSISFSLLHPDNVKLQIYNIKGQLLKTLVDAQKPTGYHTVDWNAKDMGSGLYFYKLTIKDKTFIKKMILMR